MLQHMYLSIHPVRCSKGLMQSNIFFFFEFHLHYYQNQKNQLLCINLYIRDKKITCLTSIVHKCQVQ